LFEAVSRGHEACVRVLIAAKADLAEVDSDGRTALHLAVNNRCASICRVLVDEGASLTAVNSDGKTPLELTKSHGKLECAAILEAAGAVLPPAVAAAYAFVDEHIATTRGFRFAVTKAADEQAPPGLQIYDTLNEVNFIGRWPEFLSLLSLADEQAPRGVDKQIYDAVRQGNLDVLLSLCREWAGHAVIDSYIDVSQISNTNTTQIFACSLTHQTN